MLVCTKSKGAEAKTQDVDRVTQSSNSCGLFAKRGRSTSLPVTRSQLGLNVNNNDGLHSPSLQRISMDRAGYELKDTGRTISISPCELSPTAFLRNKQIQRGERQAQIQQNLVKNETVSPAAFTL